MEKIMKTVICYSIEDEIKFLKSKLQDVKDIDLVKIGVGKKKTIKNLNKIIDKYDRFILIGFCGAVKDGLKVGDCMDFDNVCLYSNIESDKSMPENQGHSLQSSKFIKNSNSSEKVKETEKIRIIKVCPSKQVPQISQKTLCTVPFLFNKDDKKNLALKNPEIDAVDMESYYFSEIVLKNNKECVVIKAVSDNKDFIMPGFDIMNKYFTGFKYTFFIDIFLHTVQIIRFLRLKINCLIAGKKIAGFVANSITL